VNFTLLFYEGRQEKVTGSELVARCLSLPAINEEGSQLEPKWCNTDLSKKTGQHTPGFF